MFEAYDQRIVSLREEGEIELLPYLPELLGSFFRPQQIHNDNDDHQRHRPQDKWEDANFGLSGGERGQETQAFS